MGFLVPHKRYTSISETCQTVLFLRFECFYEASLSRSAIKSHSDGVFSKRCFFFEEHLAFFNSIIIIFRHSLLLYGFSETNRKKGGVGRLSELGD